MKVKELRNMTTAEIEHKINALKEELFNLRFQLATGQLENTARLSEVRRGIAKAKTILRERELGISR